MPSNLLFIDSSLQIALFMLKSVKFFPEPINKRLLLLFKGIFQLNFFSSKLQK